MIDLYECINALTPLLIFTILPFIIFYPQCFNFYEDVPSGDVIFYWNVIKKEWGSKNRSGFLPLFSLVYKERGQVVSVPLYKERQSKTLFFFDEQWKMVNNVPQSNYYVVEVTFRYTFNNRLNATDLKKCLNNRLDSMDKKPAIFIKFPVGDILRRESKLNLEVITKLNERLKGCIFTENLFRYKDVRITSVKHCDLVY